MEWLILVLVLAMLVALVGAGVWWWRRPSRPAAQGAGGKAEKGTSKDPTRLEAALLQTILARRKGVMAAGECNCAGANPNCSPPSFYTRSFRTPRGLLLQSSDRVSQSSLERAGKLLDAMISPQMEAALASYNGLKVSMVAEGEEVSDLPQYCWLKTACTFDGRCYTHVRGIGGTSADMPGVVAEENVTCSASDMYRDESITIHEFAHTLMDVVIQQQKPELYARIVAAYKNALDSGAIPGGLYISSTVNEFWAECVQAYFHASIRTDVNAGINTREALKQRLPEAFAIVHEVFDGAPGVSCNWASDGSGHYCCAPAG